MALVKQLQDAINTAKTSGDADDARQSLNQILVSNLPATSELAKEYGRELRQQGLLSKNPIEISDASVLSESHFRSLFAQAQGGMMIVNIDKKTFQEDLLVENLSGALGQSQTIVVLAGKPDDMRDFLRSQRIIATQMPLPVKILTPEEETLQRKDNIVAQWRQMRDLDIVSVGHDTAAPAKASFAKKQHKPL